MRGRFIDGRVLRSRCEGCEPIGIENNGKIQCSDQFEDEGLRLLEGSNPRSDHHRLLVFTEAKDGIESPETEGLFGCFWKGFGHDLCQFDLHDCIEALWDTEGDQARSHAQGGLTRHGGRTGLSRPIRQGPEGGHNPLCESLDGGGWRAPSDLLFFEEMGLNPLFIDESPGDADVDDLQFPDIIGSRRDEKPYLWEVRR